MSIPNDDPSQHLIELIRAGIDPEGNFERLFRLHFRGISAYFLRRGLSAEEARDSAQEVFLRVSRGLESFRGESQFRTWLLEIAESVYQNELRRRSTGKRKGKEVSLDSGDAGEEPVSFELQPMPPRALDDTLERERAELLSRAIQELPPNMRACFQLRYSQGRKYQEIAVRLGISVDTVKATLHQAKKRLKLELADKL